MNKNLTPEPQTLYPAKDSLDEAMDCAVAQLPITDRNQLTTVLLTYHNTLLEAQRHTPRKPGW